MFRNQYDTDVTLWSPAGRIHQIEYAMEAVKQGSAAVGARVSHACIGTDSREKKRQTCRGGIGTDRETVRGGREPRGRKIRHEQLERRRRQMTDGRSKGSMDACAAGRRNGC